MQPKYKNSDRKTAESIFEVISNYAVTSQVIRPIKGDDLFRLVHDAGQRDRQSSGSRANHDWAQKDEIAENQAKAWVSAGEDAD
jgi:hypothetical protein